METKSPYSAIKKLGSVSDSGVVIYNLNKGSFDYYNEIFLNIFGISKETLEKDPMILLSRVVPEDLEHLQTQYKILLEKGQVTNTEFSVRINNEAPKHLNCDVMVLEDEPIIVGIIKDITKQKTHDDFVIHYGAQKDTLLDMLTHNLGGPLHLSKDILATIGKPEEKKMAPAEMAKALKLLEENTQICLDIVNDFLKQEHDQSIRTHVRKTRFLVLEKIAVTIEQLKAMNKQKKFTISSDIPNLQVNADPVKFFQVIHNILSNAIKFTSEKGKIDIRVTEDKNDFIVIITDDGIGIPEGMKAIIFSEKMAGRTGLLGEKSSGLGLSIAKKLVNLMNGDLTFESKEFHGSSFFVRLPKE